MTYALTLAAHAQLFAHRYDRALELSTESLRISPEQGVLWWHHPRDIIALSLKRQGNAAEAGRLLHERAAAYEGDLERTREDPGVSFRLASVFAALGDTGLALEGLEEAYDGGYRRLYTLERDPFWESLRDAPEFTSILDRIRADIERMRLTIEREEIAAGER